MLDDLADFMRRFLDSTRSQFASDGSCLAAGGLYWLPGWWYVLGHMVICGGLIVFSFFVCFSDG